MNEQIELDPLFKEAVKLVIKEKNQSVAFLQRRLKIGFMRAGRLIDQMEALGIVGPYNGIKPRELICKTYEQANTHALCRSQPHQTNK